MKGLIGRKVGMTHLFRPGGERVAVTVLRVGPCVVTQCKTSAKDGYEAVQLGFEPVVDEAMARQLSAERRERRLRRRVRKPQRGQFEAIGVPAQRVLREVRVEDGGRFEVGTVYTASIFERGEVVRVVGTSKGRGTAGAMRRHHFSGHPASHGAKIHRTPASAGATDAARVFKGKRGPGRMGNARVTATGLVVELVDPEHHVIAVRGAVPGPTNGLVMVLADGGYPVPGEPVAEPEGESEAEA